nr:MAG TPA_asm: hypothetical protein [Caudoviricetes sp.]
MFVAQRYVSIPKGKKTKVLTGISLGYLPIRAF